jgi:hypothetical protein
MRGFAIALLAVPLLSGCAMNLAELRSARVLRAGEMQVTQGNNVVVPTSSIVESWNTAQLLAEAKDSEDPVTEEQALDLVGGATAIAISSPGYGTFVEYAIGLPRRFEFSARFGNGIYGVGLRKGVSQDQWHANLGIRAAYNGGGSWISYANKLNSFVEVGKVRRMDFSATAMVGREWEEWGKFWIGAKAMFSPYKLEIDASQVGLGETSTSSSMRYVGGFIGAGLGFRYMHFNVELSVLYASGDLEVFGREYSMRGLVLAPSWGFQATF